MSNGIAIWMKSVEERIRRVHTFAKCTLTFTNEQWAFVCSATHASSHRIGEDELRWEWFAPDLPEIMELANKFAEAPGDHPPMMHGYNTDAGYARDYQRKRLEQEYNIARQNADYERAREIEANVLQKLHDNRTIMIERDFATDRLRIRRGSWD